MQNHIIALSVSALVVALMGGCSTVAKNGDPSSYPEAAYWVMSPVSASLAGETQRARIGELLFRQDFVAASEAKLSERVSIPIPPASLWNKSPGNAEYAPETSFSQIDGVMRGHLAFCDRRVTYRSREPIMDGRIVRLCLVDRDRNGTFDTFYWGGVIGYWGGAIGTDIFAPSTLEGNPDQGVAIPYELQKEQTGRLLSAGAVVTESILGAYRLEFAVSDAKRPQTLHEANGDRGASTRPMGGGVLDAQIIHFRDTDIPLTLNLLGAQVEISAITDGVVSYRVKSGFDSTRPMLIGYSGELPRNE